MNQGNAKWPEVAIFALTYVVFVSLASPEFWNPQVVTRLALAVSIVEDHTLSIDRFAEQTIDKAQFDGHYYSDKVPGLSLLALPAVWLTNLRLGPFDASSQDAYVRAAAWTTTALLGALAASLTFIVSRRFGATPRQGVLAAFILSMATPYLGWSTVFFAHSASGCLLIGAAALISFAFTSDKGWPAWRLGWAVGLLLGFTIVVDVVAAPSVGLLGTLTLGLAARRGLGYGLATATLLAIAGIVGVSPLLIYNQMAFGSPFILGYAKVVGFEGMKAGFFGVTAFSPSKALELTFGPFRGLLPLAPILVLVPLGLRRMAETSKDAGVAAFVIGAVFIVFLAVNSSYEYWDGGWSTGPRHIVPAIPMLAVAMAFAWPQGYRARIFAGLLLAASAITSLACATVTMYAPNDVAFPLEELIFPGLLDPQKLALALPGVFGWVGFALIWYLAGRPQPMLPIRETTDHVESPSDRP